MAHTDVVCVNLKVKIRFNNAYITYIIQTPTELTMCVNWARKLYRENGNNVRGQGARRQGGDMQDRQEEK